MDFYIKKNATHPLIRMELLQDGRKTFKRFHECIQNADITFTMIDVDCGIRKISCRPCKLILKENCNDDCDPEYLITFPWLARDTKKTGRFRGEFKIEFLDGTGTLIAPIREELFINVIDGFTM